ncbi:hypothetical protein D1007_40650 [Hordeum vulgare]|nr:hypothetical protein D1007_40650 [Hordeum vulgare]
MQTYTRSVRKRLSPAQYNIIIFLQKTSSQFKTATNMSFLYSSTARRERPATWDSMALLTIPAFAAHLRQPAAIHPRHSFDSVHLRLDSVRDHLLIPLPTPAGVQGGKLLLHAQRLLSTTRRPSSSRPKRRSSRPLCVGISGARLVAPPVTKTTAPPPKYCPCSGTCTLAHAAHSPVVLVLVLCYCSS